MNIRERLFLLEDLEYKKFNSRLIPSEDNIIGVRIPELRKIAKDIANNNWKKYLEEDGHKYFEEIMLEGLVIGYIDLEFEELKPFIEKFIPKIDNWSVCDTFCSNLKMTKNNKEDMWDFIKLYFNSKREFDIRFAVVIALSYFIEDDYIKESFEIIDNINHDGYYVKMAVAWWISMIFVKYNDKTIEYLKDNKLDKSTHNMSIQKIIDSRRVDDNTKDIIREMRRKK